VTDIPLPSSGDVAPTSSGDVAPTSLDHVALWVSEPDLVADALCRGLGMHVIERTDGFTLVGVDARLGKLTLFAADGPRERGVLERIVLRVADVTAAVERLPPELKVIEASENGARLEGPEGVAMGFTRGAADQTPYDLDHVVLRVPDPEQAGARLAALGFARGNGQLQVGDRYVRLLRGEGGAAERPLLNHLALLVDSVDEYLAAARGRHAGLEIDEIKDAPNTYAAFVWGPDRIKLEYVEHKPGFSLV
jgi:catechol 2,3-dioxygenase-like lactoylglutathione lyase family enzyme